MNFKHHFSSLLLLVLFASCSSNSSDPISEEVVIDDPIATTLIFPEDNTECNEGTILSDTQSKVVFRWNTSENTDSYEVVLTKTETTETSNYETSTNFKEITLDRGANYEWQVISKSTESTITTSSETFQFFNAAPGIVQHVPFSAEAITPEEDSEVNTVTGTITLEWQASDIDNDIKNYEVFFGTKQDALTSLEILTATTLDVDVISGATYYWKVKTKDQTNNTSTSELFSFTVE